MRTASRRLLIAAPLHGGKLLARWRPIVRRDAGSKPARRASGANARRVAALVLVLATHFAARPGAADDDVQAAVEAYRAGNFERAHATFQPLAAAGDPRAQTILGIMHAAGEGVAASATDAARWFGKAARAGYAPAQCNLALMLARGEGVTQDRARALHWLQRAAEQGHARARMALTEMLNEEPGLARHARVAADSPDTPRGEPPARTTRAARRQPERPARAGDVRVQIGASRTREGAVAALARVRRTHGELLAGLEDRVVAARPDADATVWYRMQMGPVTRARGEALCEQLLARGAVAGCLPVPSRSP